MTNNYCFIGGSGSTGSSLLANVLNRHSKIFCGPETYVFTKHQLFENYLGHREVFSKFRLKSYAWHQYSKIDLNHQAFGWDPEKLKELIFYVNDLKSFSDEFFGYSAHKHSKMNWIEKTPSNSFGFKYLTEVFDKPLIIHMVRNPYDAIASLNRRGFSVYYATCLYLLNTAVALALKDQENYLEVPYESFVQNPNQYLKKICNLLNLDFEEKMIEKARNTFDESIQSWSKYEHESISSENTGTFNKLNRLVQEEVVYMCNSIRISPSYVRRFSLKHVSIEDICNSLHYGLYEDEGLYNHFQLQIDKTRDHLSRIIRSYPSRFKNYPIILKV